MIILILQLKTKSFGLHNIWQIVNSILYITFAVLIK